jgi:hypothetical protein
MTEPGDAVVTGLANDLAAAIKGTPVRITAAGGTASEAAEYWRTVLQSAGLVVLGAREGESAKSARIHLHDEAVAPTSYSATGLAPGEVSSDLVGEVIGQGESAADRYASLIAVADALADALVDMLAGDGARVGDSTAGA